MDIGNLILHTEYEFDESLKLFWHSSHFTNDITFIWIWHWKFCYAFASNNVGTLFFQCPPLSIVYKNFLWIFLFRFTLLLGINFGLLPLIFCNIYWRQCYILQYPSFFWRFLVLVVSFWGFSYVRICFSPYCFIIFRLLWFPPSDEHLELYTVLLLNWYRPHLLKPLIKLEGFSELSEL